jgi:GDPmannose 4,6-dehydratase
VRELTEIAFRHVGLDYRQHVVSDPRYYRPAEVELLLADPTKARRELGWKAKVSFEQLVTMMVDADLARLSAARRP